MPASVIDECRSEVDMMHKHGLLIKQSNNVFQLSALSTASVLKLQNPVPVTMSTSTDSREATVVEMRYKLIESGWTLVDKPSECQVANRKCLRCQCSGYFELLLNHCGSIEKLASFNAFSHSQQKGYYRAVMLVCTHFRIAAGLHLVSLQKRGNTDTMILCDVCQPHEFAAEVDDSEATRKTYVPPNANAEFYDGLCKFLEGLVQTICILI